MRALVAASENAAEVTLGSVRPHEVALPPEAHRHFPDPSWTPRDPVRMPAQLIVGDIASTPGTRLAVDAVAPPTSDWVRHDSVQSPIPL